MILLDASALLSLLVGQPAAAEVERLLRAGSAGITSVNLAEVIDVAVRRLKRSARRVDAALEPLIATALRVHEVGAAEGRLAGLLRSRYYDRSQSISLADSLLVACAVVQSAAIATTDALVGRIALAEGLTAIPLTGGNFVMPDFSATVRASC